MDTVAKLFDCTMNFGDLTCTESAFQGTSSNYKNKKEGNNISLVSSFMLLTLIRI